MRSKMSSRTTGEINPFTLRSQDGQAEQSGSWFRRGSTITVLPESNTFPEESSYELSGGSYSRLRALKLMPKAAIPTFFKQASTGVCPAEVDTVIRGWGQYQDAVELLPSPEQDKIAQLADLVVTSFTTPGCIPLGQIAIIGHADKDFHGAAFE